MQRPLRGSRVSSFYPVKSLPPLAALDSAFQLQEYISLLIRRDVHDVDIIVALPEKNAPKDQDELPDAAEPDAKKPDDADRKSDVPVDKACWIYEQLRRLAQDLSHPLITMLQQECTRNSCPQMKAGEWLYLCVAHGNDGAMEQCCAIDYILHTVDSATALLNSPRAFPSRLSIPQTSHRHFASLARRLGRIFAHAYFHHREAFEQAEAESSLYARFLKLTHHFDLVPAEFLVIPESAIHHDGKGQAEEVEPPRLLSAAVPPTPHLRDDPLTAPPAPDFDPALSSRPRSVDTTDHVGTDSPRRIGRSRTDTMVFSEGFSVTEELAKAEDDGSLFGTLPAADTQSSATEPSWPDHQTRTEDLDDDDASDVRSELTLTGPLSPPVVALSLISLEDTSGATAAEEVAIHDVSSASPPQDPLSDSPAVKTGAEEPVQAVDVPEETAPADETPTPEVAEPTSEEVDTPTSGPLVEPAQVLPESEQDVAAANSANETDETVPPSDEGPESHAESELPPPPDPVFELNEPPPSEPIPPESESDITDEAGGHDGDEVKVEGGEEAVVVGE